jgi:hypothetical protein
MKQQVSLSIVNLLALKKLSFDDETIALNAVAGLIQSRLDQIKIEAAAAAAEQTQEVPVDEISPVV